MSGRRTWNGARRSSTRSGSRPSTRTRAKGESTVLIKLEPGAHLPFHKHPELEQAYVLEGSMYDHDGVCHAGEYVWRKAGSFHENRSDTGAVIFAVYRKQNIFVNGTGYSSKPRKV